MTCHYNCQQVTVQILRNSKLPADDLKWQNSPAAVGLIMVMTILIAFVTIRRKPPYFDVNYYGVVIRLHVLLHGTVHH